MEFRKKLIAPSILSADFANLEQEINAVASAGADWIHVDVMDGHFVKNLTIGAPVVKSLKRASPLPLDVHLMIEKPENYLEDFARAGADYLTIHVESTTNVANVLKQIRKLGMKPGLTLRPGTAVQEVLPYLNQIDLLLVMTVEPGFGGQSFMLDQVPKIKALRAEIDRQNLKVLLEVDGGVSDQTLQYCSDVDVLVAGNYIFKNDYKKAIQILKGNSF